MTPGRGFLTENEATGNKNQPPLPFPTNNRIKNILDAGHWLDWRSDLVWFVGGESSYREWSNLLETRDACCLESACSALDCCEVICPIICYGPLNKVWTLENNLISLLITEMQNWFVRPSRLQNLETGKEFCNFVITGSSVSDWFYGAFEPQVQLFTGAGDGQGNFAQITNWKVFDTIYEWPGETNGEFNLFYDAISSDSALPASCVASDTLSFIF